MSERRYHVVLNPNSGTALALGLTAETLRERFERAGHASTVDADGEKPLAERIQSAIANDADVIVAAGGDGTITALADAIVKTDKTLGILPTGTANLLARDLHIPLELEEAIAGLRAMEPHRIDVGEVNGRVFLHNVTIGLIPGIAAGREQIRGRTDLGAKVGFFRYFLRRLARTRRLAMEVRVDDGAPRIQRLQALSVSNNTYDEGLGRIFARQHLDGGNLALHTLTHLNALDVVRLSAGMIIGRWQDYEAIKVETVQSVHLRLRKPTVTTMRDGEIEALDNPLEFRVRPKALSVLAPVLEEPESEPEEEDPGLVVGT